MRERRCPTAPPAVVALMTRMVPTAEAVARSTAAARGLQGRGADRLSFKHRSAAAEVRQLRRPRVAGTAVAIDAAA
jgi:hypothetical protein